jgi:hypothetical protein
MSPRRRRRPRVLLWTVVVEDAESGALDRVLLDGAEEQTEADAFARGLCPGALPLLAPAHHRGERP